MNNEDRLIEAAMGVIDAWDPDADDESEFVAIPVARLHELNEAAEELMRGYLKEAA
ncbi:MAG: hypothetical protein H6974_13060 [Gammaproteobacteria bacterium]|nr:hypothetical protein [Gammaproteobacteria bacterium]MCP5197694.1 hypothetical protein [Gammaproteobacteria bacterium]